MRWCLKKSRSSSSLPDVNTVMATLHCDTYAHLSQLRKYSQRLMVYFKQKNGNPFVYVQKVL